MEGNCPKFVPGNSSPPVRLTKSPSALSFFALQTYLHITGDNHMNATRALLLGALIGFSASAVPAQVGKPLPAAEVTDFVNTQAKDLKDFKGRLLLIEFFAYW